MTQDELNKLLEGEKYCIPRKTPSEAEIRLYLREVDYHCPLCGKDLQPRKRKKQNKLFEIAHIYPNRPTIEQYKELHNLEKLGNDSESYENKIALCKDCHDTQDYHTSKDDYIKLFTLKKRILNETALDEATKTLGLEEEIACVIQNLSKMTPSDIAKLKYEPVPIANKFTDNDLLLKIKITNYVVQLYPYIRDCFQQIDGKNGFHLQVLSGQIKSCFIKMNAISLDKPTVFLHIVQWIKEKTLSQSNEACEAVVAFFVQNCEVFNEIPK